MKQTTTSVYTFEDLINGDYLYVDKTKYIYNLVKQPTAMYFLSRPRRFGKSLMLSTLKAVFQNKRELFKGLYLETADYNWKEYPVIHIELGAKKITNSTELETYLFERVSAVATEHNLNLKSDSYDSAFLELIETLSKTVKVVILIDEYDKPILNNVDDQEACADILKSLKGFYGVIKSTNSHQRFVMLTGVSKFSRVSVFSDLNNLTDLTMDRRFATMFGYTQEELEANFDEPITEIANEMNKEKSQLLCDIKDWYNGYKFHHSAETIYNPVSVMKFFDSQEFSNYWFETGTPSFLLKLIEANEYELNKVGTNEVDEMAFSSYEIDNLSVLPLLFQTGYVTIKKFYIDEDQFRCYTLGFPNREVESAFNSHVINHFSKIDKEEVSSYIRRILKALRSNDLDTVFENLKDFFRKIDHSITLDKEAYYQTIFYSFFTLLGITIHTEVRTSRGRIDAVAELDDAIYIFEFKLHGRAEGALQQIHDKDYYGKYANTGKRIVLIGAAFDQQTRNIESWLTEEI